MTDERFKCKNCEEVSTADDINETTVNNCCMNRKQRRNYVPIEKTKQTDPKWYQCPSCGQNIRRRGWAKENKNEKTIS